jgi:hypothetical protein
MRSAIAPRSSSRLQTGQRATFLSEGSLDHLFARVSMKPLHGDVELDRVRSMHKPSWTDLLIERLGDAHDPF